MPEPVSRLHLEYPTEAPLTEPFQIQGWIASSERINSVACGAEAGVWLTLFERPDVRSAHPEFANAVGFKGQLSFRSIEAGKLVFKAQVGEAVLAFSRELPPVELPPDALQIRQVGGVWGGEFFNSGTRILEEIQGALQQNGVSLAEAPRVLDFGCGCGRALRNFKRLPHRGELWGCDIDPEAIAWNRAHLSDLALFDCNGVMPPLAFPDAFFDVIYSVSVFTHLPEEMQLAWLTELRRVLKPGGTLLATLHGERYWTVDPRVKAEVLARGFAYRTGSTTDGLPSFYMTAFHSHAYVRREWARIFDVIDLKTSYIHGVHDAAIVRRAG